MSAAEFLIIAGWTVCMLAVVVAAPLGWLSERIYRGQHRREP
jgi:hypothetical protein